jgi:beta-lactamase superfamily II metal-dependent hydrolase
MPEATERGERFRSDVEKILTKGAIVPKHGSKTFSTPDFIAAVAPSVSILLMVI